jgi:hypothetical protein
MRVIELQPLKVSVAVTDFWGEYTLIKQSKIN